MKKDFHKWTTVRGNTSGDVTGLVADISKVKKTLKWQPTVRLEIGISKMKDWLDKIAYSRKG